MEHLANETEETMKNGEGIDRTLMRNCQDGSKLFKYLDLFCVEEKIRLILTPSLVSNEKN